MIAFYLKLYFYLKKIALKTAFSYYISLKLKSCVVSVQTPPTKKAKKYKNNA